MDQALNKLISSIEHAEEIVNRMEATSDQARDHNEVMNTLGMHRFVMKVYAIILVVVIIAVATGGIVVTNMIIAEEHHQEADASKYENLVNTVKAEQVSNQMLMRHLISMTEELHKKK